MYIKFVVISFKEISEQTNNSFLYRNLKLFFLQGVNHNSQKSEETSFFFMHFSSFVPLCY